MVGLVDWWLLRFVVDEESELSSEAVTLTRLVLVRVSKEKVM